MPTRGAVGRARSATCIAGIKTVRDIDIGDTITDAERPAAAPLPGYKEAKPVVFSSIYPMSTDDYGDLAKALDKLVLNDASLIYEKDSSAALGFGFRCGFLGLLHLEVVQERLEREYDLSLLLSAPSVRYRVPLKNGERAVRRQPELLPRSVARSSSVEEPFIKASIMMPERYIGPVMELCRERRGVNTHVPLPRGRPRRADLRAAARRGAVRLLRPAQVDHPGLRLVRLRDARLPRRPTWSRSTSWSTASRSTPLSQLVHRDKARARALHYCERLAETIPRHQFKIAIQGAIGGNDHRPHHHPAPCARTSPPSATAATSPASASCWRSRKKGKKRMKMVGAVEIPQSAFVAVLKTDTD